MIITPDGLKKMAATNVAELKSGTPLNQSITKMAMDNELNSDQVKRLVETTNQMAYLSELDGKDDRTFEFPVADYDEVMDGLVNADGIQKAASHSTNPLDVVSGVFQPIEKVAQEKEATLEKWGKGQKIQALKKVAAQERRRLDDLKEAEHDNLVKLAQHKEIVCRDPDVLEKAASFENGEEMVKLLGLEKVAEDVRRIWRGNELDAMRKFSEDLTLIKQASEEMIAIEAKVEQAEGILKEAFLAGAAATAAKIKKGTQSVKGAVKKDYQGAERMAKKIPKLGNKAMWAGEKYGAADMVNSSRNREQNVWNRLRG